MSAICRTLFPLLFLTLSLSVYHNSNNTKNETKMEHHLANHIEALFKNMFQMFQISWGKRGGGDKKAQTKDRCVFGDAECHGMAMLVLRTVTFDSR